MRLTASWARQPQGFGAPDTSSLTANQSLVVDSSLPDDQLLEEHVRNVLAQLDKNSDAFREVSTRFGGTMELVAYCWAEYPGLFFDKDIVTGLARYGLAVDLDFYCLYSHRREDTEG